MRMMLEERWITFCGFEDERRRWSGPELCRPRRSHQFWYQTESLIAATVVQYTVLNDSKLKKMDSRFLVTVKKSLWVSPAHGFRLG